MVTTTTARVDIYEEIYDVINNNLVTTGVKIGAAFADDIAEFPQIVIHIPMLQRERESMGTDSKAYNRSGNVDIEIYTEDPYATALLVDEVENTLFSNQTSLSIQNINTGSSSEIQLEIGGKTVYGLLIPLSFHYS